METKTRESFLDQITTADPQSVKGAYSFCHPMVLETIQEVVNWNHPAALNPDALKEEFKSRWIQWITHSYELNFSGCEKNREWAICNGIHDALIHQIHHVSKSRKIFYTFSGDYGYYHVLLKGYNHKVIHPEDIPDLQRDSYILLSVPNHSGYIPTWLEELKSVCLERDIKIFLDCAFFGTILNGRVDTAHPAFDAVAFSISKAFMTGGCRVGIVFSSDLSPALSRLMEEPHNYWPVNNVLICNSVLKSFSATFMPELCKPVQERICEVLGLEPCDIFMFGVGKTTEFKRFHRPATNYSRLCLTDIIQKEILNQ